MKAGCSKQRVSGRNRRYCGDHTVTKSKLSVTQEGAPTETRTDHSTERIKVLTEALKEVLNSGIELDDARMNYVVMQVDRSTLADARDALVEQGE